VSLVKAPRDGDDPHCIVKDFCLPHTSRHVVAADAMVSANNAEPVSKKALLTEQELVLLRSFGAARAKRHIVQTTMDQMFPGRRYDPQLVYRTVAEGRSPFGDDDGSFILFMERGIEIKSEGGTFDVHMCSDTNERQELLENCTLMSEKISTRVKSAAKKLQEAKVSLPTAPDVCQSLERKITNKANHKKAATARKESKPKRSAASRPCPGSAPPAKKASSSPSLDDASPAKKPSPSASEEVQVVEIEGAKPAALIPHRQVLVSLDVLGTVTNSKGDGNCGFYASKSALQAIGFIQSEMGIVEFRKSIYEHAIKIKSLFIGDNPSYTRVDGAAPPVFNPHVRSSRSAVTFLESHFQREIRHIYQPRVSHLPFASHSHWMRDSVVLPILAFKYCTTMVSFVGFKKGAPRSTLIFQYDKKNRKVILEEHRGFVEPPPESVCIVGNGNDHFQWTKPTTCT